MIQFYSTTLGGAIADNEPRSVNVHTGYVRLGASPRSGGVCCYGEQPSGFTGIRNNTLVESDGLGFFNETQSSYSGVSPCATSDCLLSEDLLKYK